MQFDFSIESVNKALSRVLREYEKIEQTQTYHKSTVEGNVSRDKPRKSPLENMYVHTYVRLYGLLAEKA